MKLRIAAALALVTAAMPAFSADGPSRLDWAVDVGTHVYDAESVKGYRPSLELGVHAELTLMSGALGTFMLGGGLSDTGLHGASEFKQPILVPSGGENYTVTSSQIGFRRLFLAVGFETHSRWFLKPEIGFEYLVAKERIYDPVEHIGFNVRKSDSNAYVSLGAGYRYADGRKAVLSLSTLADIDDQNHFRMTLSASL